MVQYGVLKTYLTRRGENARSSGFLARFLVCYPPSTQGTRYITNPVISTEHVHEFHKRIKSIMYESQSLDSSDSKMLLLNLDPEAQQCWINYYNEIESQLLPNGYLYYFKEYASKVADNAARIAALIHYFIGNDGCISLETMNCAIVLSRWYLNEYIRVFSIPNEEQTAQLEADELFFWINNLCMTNGLVFLKKNHLLQYGPNKFREKKKLDFIINILYQQNRIQIRKDKKTNYIGIVQPRYTQNIPPELIYKH